MSKTILVPLDGSEVAEAALANIEDLALCTSSGIKRKIVLLQVVSNITYNVLTTDESAQIPYKPEDLKQIEGKAQSYLEKHAERFRSKGIEVETKVAIGHAAEQIVDIAQSIDADVIAMSTHGLSGIKRWALGSVADKVLHTSSVPVLVVRAK